MEFKIVISDPKTGKSYQADIADEKAQMFMNLRVGDEVDGAAVGLSGYKILITGGSDRSGFPMKRGVSGSVAKNILMKDGVGYNPVSNVRKKKRVRGERIGTDIVQVNTKVTQYGSRKIDDIFGAQKDEQTQQSSEETPAEAEPQKKQDVKKEVKIEKAKATDSEKPKAVDKKPENIESADSETSGKKS